MPVLEAYELYRFYHSSDEETLALRGVSLTVEARETLAVVGPSGSGKSTLLACLAGLDEPDGGRVRIMGEPMTRRSESVRAELRAKYMGILLQSQNLFDHLSIVDNIRLQMCLAGVVDAQREHRLLEHVGISSRGRAYPRQLSGGELARAGLAVALAAAPPILLADEPTGEVDAQTERDIIDLFHRRRREGGATLIVTHSSALAASADRVIRLVDGKSVEM